MPICRCCKSFVEKFNNPDGEDLCDSCWEDIKFGDKRPTRYNDEGIYED